MDDLEIEVDNVSIISSKITNFLNSSQREAYKLLKLLALNSAAVELDETALLAHLASKNRVVEDVKGYNKLWH